MYRIVANISSIEGLRCGRVYVIEASDGLTLVDTSFPNALPLIEKDLRRGGYQLSDIKRILITHAHPDHVGSLAALKARTGARIYVHHRYESAIIRGEQLPRFLPSSQFRGFSRLASAWLQALQPIEPTQVDYELKEGDRIDDALPGLEVIDLPGHSPGHCGFWQAETQLLFGGDVLMNLPPGLSLPLAAATLDLAEAKRSIHKVSEMNVATLCPGHGKPLRKAASLLRSFACKVM